MIFQKKDNKVNWIALLITVAGFVCVFPARILLGNSWMMSCFGKVVYRSGKYSDSYNLRWECGSGMLILFGVTAILLLLKKSKAAFAPAVLNAIFCICEIIRPFGFWLGRDNVRLWRQQSAYVDASLNLFFWLVIIFSIMEVVAILVIPRIGSRKQKQSE